ncbi:unknown [[Mannheimia] succiniciproducens MBEL55E]|uniref:Uncharacterized protein n=1 Tax=Mannheimia succiniciproducens (strain KCTC 0769BP / MBEL55E) TaxID=221988 RepID=Q65TS8_MANSM|nr:unknown [[Mannheimia] succiniciproducens MBEL55E]
MSIVFYFKTNFIHFNMLVAKSAVKNLKILTALFCYHFSAAC